MLDIKKTDFELLPSKISIARLYTQRLYRLSNFQHVKTHEQLYDELEEAYSNMFGQKLPWASFDSFRMYLKKNKGIIY